MTITVISGDSRTSPVQQLHDIKAAVLQMLKKTIYGKYWSSYVQWRNQLLLTPNSGDKIFGKTSFFFA